MLVQVVRPRRLRPLLVLPRPPEEAVERLRPPWEFRAEHLPALAPEPQATQLLPLLTREQPVHVAQLRVVQRAARSVQRLPLP